MHATITAQGVFVTEDLSIAIPRYQDMVYRIAYAYCKNTADAEDITQDVFVRFIKNAACFTEEEHIKAWLIRAVINASKNLLRSAWRRKIAPLTESEPAPTEDVPNVDVYNAVMSLAEKYRTVILLYYYEGYSVKETARILKRTETAVQTQLQRARLMLKEKLREEWLGD
jgi:RNA polymerase sigma-70 factor (ECF subfamily)